LVSNTACGTSSTSRQWAGIETISLNLMVVIVPFRLVPQVSPP
jgi:hypothetical protein